MAGDIPTPPCHYLACLLPMSEPLAHCQFGGFELLNSISLDYYGRLLSDPATTTALPHIFATAESETKIKVSFRYCWACFRAVAWNHLGCSQFGFQNRQSRSTYININFSEIILLRVGRSLRRVPARWLWLRWCKLLDRLSEKAHGSVLILKNRPILN